MKKTVVFLVILSFVSRISGFLREVFMAWRFGASIHTDTYIAAMTVPVMIVSLITVGLNNSLIPVLAAAEKKGQREMFFNRLLSILGIIAISLMGLIIVLARPLNTIIVRGFGPDELARVIYYSRMMAVVALFQIMSYALMGYLQQNNRFYIAATASIPMNLGTIIGVIVSPDPNSILIMVMGTIVGYFLQLLWVLLPVVRMKGFRFRFDLTLSDEHFHMLLLLIVPVLITLSTSQLNGIISRAIASGLGEGSISLLNYAQKVNGLFYQTLIVTLSTVLFTRQAKLSSDQNWKEIFLVTRENLSSIMLLIVPLVLGMMFLSTEVIQLIFQRGEFTAKDSVRGGMILLLYSPSLISLSVNEILSKMFFAMRDSKKPMISTFVNISVSIALSLLLYRRFGVNGLAVAYTVASLSGIAVLSWIARRKFHQEGVSFWSKSYQKYLLAGGLMLVVLFLFKRLPGVSGLPVMIYTLASGLVGAVSYFIGLYLLRTPELMQLIQLIKGRLRRS